VVALVRGHNAQPRQSCHHWAATQGRTYELTPHPAFGHPLPNGEGIVLYAFSIREKVPQRGG